MKFRHRELVVGEKFEAFRSGFHSSIAPAKTGNVLASDQNEGFGSGDVVRLSIKIINRRPTLVALLAQPNAPAGRSFELPLPTAAPLAQLAAWESYGAQVGEISVGWFTPESQLLAQAAARVAGRDVWQSPTSDDLIQDEVDAWEATWRAHLNGKLHPKAKEDLARQLRDFLGALHKMVGFFQERPAEAPARKSRKKKAVAE